MLLFLGLFNKESKIIRIPLEFSSGSPLVAVEIEGKPHYMILDLGNSCEFTLKRDVLETILKKERQGIRTNVHLDGQKSSVPKYLLQRMQIQNGEIIHTIVEEDSEITQENVSGRIGRNTLQTCNLLLDFSHSLIFILRDFDDLRKEKYSKKDFQEIPFRLTRWGAVFNIETDLGIKRFFINTSAPFSAIRKLQYEEEKIITAKFKIGKIDLGNTYLNPIDIDQALDDIDGYLGIDFLKNNILYLDYKKSKAWICPEKFQK